MKQIKAYVHRHRAADLLHRLGAGGFDRISVFDVKGVLTALNRREQQYSVEFGEPIVNELQIEMFCENTDVARAVELFRQYGRTGQTDAGWIYVLPVEAAHRIGSDEGAM
ncbi:MAG: P-II family nitrogen regulator [Lysobacter sp.]|nr:MAG: P-II family nitrogen regulator [Lysobacter sp.]